jgi:hypothetical protein
VNIRISLKVERGSTATPIFLKGPCFDSLNNQCGLNFLLFLLNSDSLNLWIGNMIRKFIEVDEHTKLQVRKTAVKICVEIDLKEGLPKELEIVFG